MLLRLFRLFWLLHETTLEALRYTLLEGMEVHNIIFEAGIIPTKEEEQRLRLEAMLYAEEGTNDSEE